MIEGTGNRITRAVDTYPSARPHLAGLFADHHTPARFLEIPKILLRGDRFPQPFSLGSAIEYRKRSPQERT
jgi:hypothetical protein